MMAVNNELRLRAKNGELSIADISVSELQELVLQADTRTHGLAIIGQASINAIMSILAEKMNALNINNEENEQLVKKYERMVFIKDGEVTVNKEEVVEAFWGYLSYYFEPSCDSKPKINCINVLKGIFNVPNNIRLIVYANKINRQVDKMDQKYLGISGEYCLPQKIKEGMDNILHEAETNDAFFKRMKFLGKEDFFRQAIKNTAELGRVFEEYGKDAEELKSLMKQQQSYIKRKIR